MAISVSGSEDRTIKIWGIKSWSVKKELNAHQSSINALAILKNGNIASGSTDKSIIIWNTNLKKKS
jgi:WD40 repeat protein